MKKLLIILIAITGVVTSCKKSIETENPSKESTCKLNVWDGIDGLYQYQSDANGKLTSNVKTDYTWSTSDGKINKIQWETGLYGYYSLLTYTDGYLSKIENYTNDNILNERLQLTWTNGNLTDIVDVVGLNYAFPFTYTYKLTYGSEVNKTSFDLALELVVIDNDMDEIHTPNLSLNLLGQQSKNLVTSMKEVSSVSNFLIKYTINENGLPTKIVSQYGDDTPNTYSLKYECK